MKKILLILVFIIGIFSHSNKISVYIDDKLSDFNENSYINWNESDATKYNGFYGIKDKKLKVIVYQRPYGTFVTKTFYYYNKNSNELPIKSENNNARYVFVKLKNNKDNEKGILVKRDTGENYDYLPYTEGLITLGKYSNMSLTHILQEDLKKMSKQDMKIMRNEIYARYGYIFAKNGDMDKYFRKQEWYKPMYKDVEVFLTRLEKENITYIKAFESPEYYEDQYNNDFLKFYDEFSEAVFSGNYDEIRKYVNFPFRIFGNHDNDRGFILQNNNKDKKKFENIFKYALYSIEMSDQVDTYGRPKLIEYNNILNKENYFSDRMISKTSNHMGNMNFENIKGDWKLTGISIEPADYDEAIEYLK